MKTKLQPYVVEIVYRTVIAAESQADAERHAHYVIKNEDDSPPEKVTSIECISKRDLPEGWNSYCIPFSESQCDDTLGIYFTND